MAKDNVVEFPYAKISNPLTDPNAKIKGFDHEMDVAKECLAAVIEKLAEYQYYVDSYNDPLFDDLGIVLNIVHAALCRRDGIDHIMLEMMDEITHTIKNLKDEIENDRN